MQFPSPSMTQITPHSRTDVPLRVKFSINSSIDMVADCDVTIREAPLESVARLAFRVGSGAPNQHI
jgi:hypothetical protein